MGDLSTEPSMEEILSSIKRIIAEEGDNPPGRQRRQTRGTPASEPGSADEVLELNHPVPHPQPQSYEPAAQSPKVAPPEPAPAEPAAQSPKVAPPEPAPAEPAAEAFPSPAAPIVSSQTAAATRGSLDALTRLVVKPEPDSDGTLEGLVREMLRPMLREWLDAKLPDLVQTMVAKEIAKITGQMQ